MLISLVLYVLFGQITVRKLCKNPATKNELCLEFVSGWDIINVAQALSLPRSIIRKLSNTPIGFLYADADLLLRYTTVFDRFLAKVFYWLFMFSGISMITLVILDYFSFFLDK